MAAEDAGLYRDALGAVPPGGLPEVFLEEVEEPLARLARRYARTHGPFTTREVVRPLRRSTAARCCASWSGAGGLVRGELRPGGSEREWCDPDVLRRLRRASLATLRKEVEPAEQRALARFLPAWQGVDGAPPGARRGPPARAARAAPGACAGTRGVGARRAPAPRPGAYSPAWLDELCASGELVWVGRRRPRPQLRAGGPATSARTPAGSARRPRRASARPARCTMRSASASPAGAAFWADLLADMSARSSRSSSRRRSGTSPGRARSPTTPSHRCARRGSRSRRPRATAGRRFARRRRPGAPQVQGRWSLTAALFADAPAARSAHARHGRGAARALRHRHPRDGARRGHPRRVRRALRRAVEPGDAGHGPARLLRRGPRRRAVRLARRHRAPARRCAPTSPPARWCWPPPTPPTRSARR